jgi:hypothetical protein
MPTDHAQAGWKPIHWIVVLFSFFVAGPLGMLLTALASVMWTRRAPGQKSGATSQPAPPPARISIDPFWKPFPDPEDPLKSHRDLFED